MVQRILQTGLGVSGTDMHKHFITFIDQENASSDHVIVQTCLNVCNVKAVRQTLLPCRLLSRVYGHKRAGSFEWNAKMPMDKINIKFV